MGRKRKDLESRELEQQRRQMRRGVHLMTEEPKDLEIGNVNVEDIIRETLILPEMLEISSNNATGELRVVDSAVAVSMLLPPTTVAKAVKLSQGLAMSPDVPVLISKALEQLISELMIRSFLKLKMEEPKKSRILPSHISAGIAGLPKFDFLRDIVPPDELISILHMHQ